MHEVEQMLHEQCERRVKEVALHCGVAPSTVHDWLGKDKKRHAPMNAIFGITQAVGFGPIQYLCRLCGGFFVPLKRSRKNRATISEVLRSVAQVIDDDAKARDPESSSGAAYSENELRRLEIDVDVAINGLVAFVADKRDSAQHPTQTYFAESLAAAERAAS